MKIIELRADGFARLTALTIRPDGALVQITGENGAGKTSTLNAIWAALKGRAVAPPVPIRKGAEEARLLLSLGDQRVEMTVERVFRKDKHGDLTTSLTVTSDGNRVVKAPQAAIDAVLGACTIDPLAFARMDAKAQFDAVRALVPSFDFDAAAERRRALYEERTAVGRLGAQAKAEADRIQVPPGPKPARIGAEAADALSLAMDINSENDTLARDRKDLDTQIEQWLDEAEQLRARAASMERQAKQAKERLDAMVQPAAPIDTTPLREALRDAGRINAIVEQHERREIALAQAATHRSVWDELTAAIEAEDEGRRKAIAAAKLPVDGLSFGDGVVLLDDLPLSQAAMSKKIRVSAQLTMALNPEPDKLRVLTIDEGSELDSKALAMICQMAEEADYQVWVCRVDETGSVGFVIRDGQLAE